mgnify:CR=1 FL=1
MTIEFSKSAYSVSALQKAAYEVSVDVNVVIAEGPENYLVTATAAREGAAVDLVAFTRMANDFSLRERLASKTELLRNLILAHAYSKTRFTKA